MERLDGRDQVQIRPPQAGKLEAVSARSMFNAERITMRRGRAAVACNSLVKSVLVVDIGGTSVKVMASGPQTHRSFPSRPQMTAKEMVSRVEKLAGHWAYDVLSIRHTGPLLPRRTI